MKETMALNISISTNGEIFSGNTVCLLHNSSEYFQVLKEALNKAKHAIYLESYIFSGDTIGRLIGEALQRAALRGVSTHLLIDGFGSKDFPKTMRDFLEKAGVQVQVYRPQISPWTFQRKRLRRLHRKLLVIDSEIAFVGGINITRGSCVEGKFLYRYDFAVRIEGPLVKKIHGSAVRLWRRVAGASHHRFFRRPSSDKRILPTIPAGCAKSAFIVRDNFRHRRDIENCYLQAINQADTEIILVNAYFLPGLNVRHALVNAAGRGVRVVLLLQGKVDHWLYHKASRALYGNFLKAGIEIYEYHQSILHAKVAVIDDHWATVGSSNLDPFSLLLSLEANIIVDNGDFAKELRDSLQLAIKLGAERIHEKNLRTQTTGMRLVSWLSYGLVRFLTGIAGYAPGKSTAHDSQSIV